MYYLGPPEVFGTTKTLGMTHVFWLLLIGFFLKTSALFAGSDAFSNWSHELDTDPPAAAPLDEAMLIERLAQMQGPVQMKYTPAVRSYLNSYLVRNPHRAEQMIGRASMYFPIFEAYLEAHNLPQELKYLAVVESALNPVALSRVGARGLWQFMEQTGLGYDLIINSVVDERSDTHRATEAAMVYLARQYERFGSWELALAAYNAGPGRVNKAIRRGKSKDFWRIQKYLPKETRNYVPAFIAASYLMEYYALHGLSPQYPDLDLQLTGSVLVFEPIPFSRVAEITGLSLETIETLNPGYKHGHVPFTPRGHHLVLPLRVLPAIQEYLLEKPCASPLGPLPDLVESGVCSSDSRYLRGVYRLQEADTCLTALGKKLSCSTYSLVAWNGLQLRQPEPGEELVFYYPRKVRHLRSGDLALLEPLPSRPFYTPEPPVAQIQQLRVYTSIHTRRKGRFLYYEVPRQESVYQIADRFDDVSVRDILLLNRLSVDDSLKPGSKVRIKKL
jgi:membrane-bound lytic murein transglycosylase D